MKAILRSVLFRDQPLPVTPFGTRPRAPRETYVRLHEAAKRATYPAIDDFEERQGFAIDRAWLDELALHTQVVVKDSQLNYSHGRLLYARLRRYIADAAVNAQVAIGEPITILETGTARGFSAICMAKALIDGSAPGYVATIDALPHNTAMLWNCIDDHEGPKTRQALLAPWGAELARVVFVQGWTRGQLQRTGLARVHFAFLDAQHTTDDVLGEYRYACERQEPGDVIVFDDLTSGLFDGVVKAVEQIEAEGKYAIERLQVSPERGYAIAVRLAR